MPHSSIIKTVQLDLAQLSAGFTKYWSVDPEELPVTLSYVTDVAGVRDIVESRSLKAVHSGFGAIAADIRNGIKLVESFLVERLRAETDPIRIDFCQEVLANFNPRGTWFESFLIRFFEDEETVRMTGDDCSGYALALRTAGMGISRDNSGTHGNLRFGKAVYSQEEQLARLISVYSACEDCYVDALHLFGEECQEDFLVPCWDWFRHAAGELSMLFRDPSRAAEKEWVATALDLRPEAEQNNDNVEFELCDNAFAPYVRVGMPDKNGTGKPGIPIKSAVIDCTVQSPAAEDGLRAFLRKNGVFQVIVRRASLP